MTVQAPSLAPGRPLLLRRTGWLSMLLLERLRREVRHPSTFRCINSDPHGMSAECQGLDADLQPSAELWAPLVPVEVAD